jgi:hypothetical protein
MAPQPRYRPDAALDGGLDDATHDHAWARVDAGEVRRRRPPQIEPGLTVLRGRFVCEVCGTVWTL